uniref:Uncharacterized protein n=1 Tax=Ditylenchus dipsaci TaxID=166011 RepID=A0A915DG83_9BILA
MRSGPFRLTACMPEHTSTEINIANRKQIRKVFKQVKEPIAAQANQNFRYVRQRPEGKKKEERPKNARRKIQERQLQAKKDLRKQKASTHTNVQEVKDGFGAAGSGTQANQKELIRSVRGQLKRVSKGNCAASPQDDKLAIEQSRLGLKTVLPQIVGRRLSACHDNNCEMVKPVSAASKIQTKRKNKAARG